MIKKCYVFLILLLTFGFAGVNAQTRFNLQGVVTSGEDGLPIIGASVLVEGTTRGVTTSLDGDYAIEVSVGERLSFSYLGMQTQTFEMKQGVTQINVVLEGDQMALDEVVVVAYGTRKKGTIAGSVGTVKGDVIESVPTPSFDQALQGQVAGLTVLSNSGDPTASATFQIRGTNSINSGTEPLFILDGAPISSSDFNAISPSDIENVSVLKDASSTSIYGARAANGVVIITTKRGKMGEKPTIKLRGQYGISNLAYGNWDIMNTEQRIRYEKEVGLDAGKDYSKLSLVNVDWRDHVYRNNAPLQSYDLSISGANESLNYYLSGNFYDQMGIAYGSDFQRVGMRGNFDVKAANWMKIGMNTMFTFENFAETDQGSYYLNTPISASRFMMPYYSPYNEDGSMASVNDGTWLGGGENPLEWADNNPLSRSSYKVLLIPYIEFKPIEALTIRSQLGYDYSQMLSLITSTPSYKPNNGSGYAGRGTTTNQSISLTNTATYRTSFRDKHDFTFLLGQEYVDNTYKGFDVSTRGQNNDLLVDLNTGTQATSWSNFLSSYSYLSFFGRAEYTFDQRLYADVSIRSDASSRFGKGNRWGAFWSTGLMWDLSREDFMSDIRWINRSQIAISTGTSGNSSIPNYDHLGLVAGGSDYVGNPGVIPLRIDNPNLSWESTWTTNLAFRFGFFNRIDAELEMYYKRTTDMLMHVPMNFSTNNGVGFEWQNVGAMMNRGFELALSGSVIRTRDFNWSLNATLSYNQNRILELYNGVKSYVNAETGMQLNVGKPVGSFFMNHFAGVDPLNGDALWYTKDGEITNKMREEDKILFDKTPYAPWQGGFGTNLSWKGLSASAHFSWVSDRWMVNNDRFFDESNGRFGSFNQSTALFDRWKEPGDITNIPRHGVFTELDSRLLEDASFLRLKNVSINYAFPKQLMKKTKFIEAVSVYVSGQNLLTFTEFSGLDPESSLNVYKAAYPMSKQYTVGVDITF